MNFLGRPVRKTNRSSSLHLTFDDGPDKHSTPRVLDTLAATGAKCTFFVIAERARQNRDVLARILREGHTIGNHSLDHSYGVFFKGRKALQAWIESSEHLLEDMTGGKTAGFRPPAGVRTPELAASLEHLRIPLILWNCRFYDTVFDWTRPRALGRLAKTVGGSIVLLHDRKPEPKLPLFLETLHDYMNSARQTGFTLDPLTRELCERS
ncbi:MAG TPA: polysaccharide deacetylase family protein [Bdellovibrionales bacterium]|nr:polysaccharide deacetylase family protein [Bdellovibrionales bacterium]